MRMCAHAALVCADSDVISSDAPAAAREALRCQLLAAARQTISQGIQLVGQASQAMARMAASSDKAVPRLPDPKACSSVVVQLRLLDGQVITQPMVSIAAGTFIQHSEAVRLAQCFLQAKSSLSGLMTPHPSLAKELCSAVADEWSHQTCHEQALQACKGGSQS